MPATIRKREARSEKSEVVDAHRIGSTAGLVLREKYPGLSVDQLLTWPDRAVEVCRATNLRLQRQLKHHEVLTQLLNARKRGDLKTT